jgi:thioredoxin 1
VNLQSLEAEIKDETQPVLVEFWAPWCAPCRMMAPALDQLAGKYSGRVVVRKINADEHPDLLRELNVMAIPTMLVMQDGKVIQRRVGAQSPQALGTLFERLAQGETQPESLPAAGMDPVLRMLRLTTGLALALLAVWLTNWPLLFIGGALAFWGWYDRCPVWQALAARLFPPKTPLPGGGPE